jgi:hypothetical protein
MMSQTGESAMTRKPILKRSESAKKAWKTRRWRAAFAKARAAESASKQALQAFCQEHGWRVIFLEGPRTGHVRESSMPSPFASAAVTLTLWTFVSSNPKGARRA